MGRKFKVKNNSFKVKTRRYKILRPSFHFFKSVSYDFVFQNHLAELIPSVYIERPVLSTVEVSLNVARDLMGFIKSLSSSGHAGIGSPHLDVH